MPIRFLPLSYKKRLVVDRSVGWAKEGVIRIVAGVKVNGPDILMHYKKFAVFVP